MQDSIKQSINSHSAGMGRWGRRLRLLSIGVIILALLILTQLLPMGRMIDTLELFVQKMGIWGPVIFAGVYAIATVLMLPGAALTLAAGAIFGLVWGTFAVSVGSTTGAAMALGIGRYLARDAVERRLSRFPRFRAVDKAVSQGGWKIVALLRLSPAVPFNLQNYLYGLTAIRFWPCVLASWIAMLPGTFMYVYLGYAGRASVAAATTDNAGRSLAQWIMLGIGLLATIAVTFYVTRLARLAIARESDSQQRQPHQQETARENTMSIQPTRPIVTALHVIVAISMLVVTGCTYANPGLLAGLFGPPQTTLQESYASKPDGPTFEHDAFDKLLKHYVDERGGVNYAGLLAQRGVLQSYMARIAKAPFDELGRDQKLALLINAYNAFTLELILEHWDNGKLRSIKDIPDADRWNAKRWKIGGALWSLNQIEHEMIRPHFKEPRIHFALVCGAVGCPPLRNEAYQAATLDTQLESQAQYVHTHDRWYRLNTTTHTVFLTQLYNWYGGDFVQAAGSVLNFAARYDPKLKQMLQAGSKPSIQWLDYDWSLNRQENVH